MRYVLLAACRDDEKAYEISNIHTSDRLPHGTFSYALYNVLRSFMDPRLIQKPENGSVTGDAGHSTDSKETQQFNSHPLLELNWLDIFPLVVESVQKIRKARANGEQTPQLIGLRAWRVFGCQPKPVPRFFPADVESVDDINEDSKFLHVKMNAGYLHGIETESRWELRIFRASNSKSGTSSIDSSEKLSVTDLSITQINATETSMEVIIKLANEEEGNKLFLKDKIKEIKLKSIQRFDSTSDSELSLQDRNQNMAGDEGKNVIASVNSAIVRTQTAMQYATTLLLWAKLSDNFKITQESENQSPKLALKSIVDNRTVFSSDTSEYFKFFKNVEAFIRWTRLLELYNSGLWPSSTLPEFDRVNIVITLLNPTLNYGSSYGQERRDTRRTKDLLASEFSKDSPLEVSESEKFMIEAWTSPTERNVSAVSEKSVHLTLLEFDSDCAINVLHPQPGTSSQPLLSTKTRIGQLTGPGTIHILTRTI